MDFVEEIRRKAQSNKQRIVLPEGTERRTLQAANFVIKEKIADIILIAPTGFVEDYAKTNNLPYLLEATCIDPLNHSKMEKYADMIVELRKVKGVDIETARERQNFSQEVINVICHFRGNIVGGKRIMKLIGLDLGKNRTPFQNMTDEEEAQMKAELEAIHFFDRCNKF